ncbi:hypothetical protein PHSY_001355 [Pseudozyma hubeiensis SY62]|uniref:BZIP domain-containing protein n=1 Tax=Pseudozyma hubeiensis (strain SY62) TaxID=1305764 RepID=R9P6T1_PSEHS|nr:hypothetical protein PHSY_001355 [Pseudozyma hubeiensis SY62]GAC93790.1 hypothetical protein PHSY_001355 [Pseudozyma hubeiensis SY62]
MPSALASSSRHSETSVKQETFGFNSAESSPNSKKRKVIHDQDDDDEQDDEHDLDDSASSSASPSKSSHIGGRRKASDEERKARLEARQARNRLSAQYSRERKKAYVETLEGSLNDLKAENTLLRQQREQDQSVRQALDAKLNEAQLRVTTLETILRTVAPSLIPLLGVVRKVGSNVDVNGSSIVNQGYPLASQISVPALEQPSSIAASAQVPLTQHVVEAKAAGVAREAEALLSNFIDLDAKPAHSDATIAAQDQGSSTPTAPSQPVSVGENHAATAAAGGALRPADASADGLASLSTVSTGLSEGASDNSSSNQNKTISETGESAIFNTISLSLAQNEEQSLQERFRLLNSPLLPTERNMWELATDAMLQDIYSTSQDTAANVNTDADVSSSEMDVSAGSSPFDLVDLDIEIEEPLQLNIGLGDEDAVGSGFLPASHERADVAGMDWSGLMASLVA